tara:strand:- start:257 stop:646 length:390 start_codon:yes stop_codon:yes gene_type:complete
MKNLILIMVLIFSTNLIAQPFNVPKGFTYMGDAEYLCRAHDKSEAIEICLHVYDFYEVNMNEFSVDKDSKVLMFRYFESDRKNHVYILYAIEYKDEYDVVLREIKDKDTYLFSYDDYDGYTYDLIYRRL